MVKKHKAVFFDRDGVLNHTLLRNGKPCAPRSVEDFKIFSYAKAILNKLVAHNYLIFVVTNQPDVGNGYIPKSLVVEMNNIICTELPIDRIFVCYHSQNQNCFCRKPNTGMLEQAKKSYALDIQNSFIVGDRFTDIEAGKKFKLKTILLGKGYGEKKIVNPDFQIDKLDNLLKIILKQ